MCLVPVGDLMSILNAKLNKYDVIDTYTKTAPVYDFWGMLTETKAREKAMYLANINNGETVLEVAIGTGLTFLEILKANPDGNNFGLDITDAMLKKAKSRIEKLDFKNYTISLGDAYDLEFPENHFDLLINNYMFDLLPEDDFPSILNEFKRVLKPNGRLVLVNMTKGDRFYQRFWEIVYRINPKWLGGCRGMLLSDVLRKVGFDILHNETLSQFGFPSEVISAKILIPIQP
jgi:ubiquinone/menaquinone biosynthesis C-methylase UbiE